MNDNTDRDTLIDVQPYSDSELDSAMRELEELQAEANAMADLRILRSHWARRMVAAMAGILALCAALPALADAPRVKRPVVCTAGRAVEGVGYICTDGKRPRIFPRFTVVSFQDETGARRSYVLGWATVAAAKPAATVKL